MIDDVDQEDFLFPYQVALLKAFAKLNEEISPSYTISMPALSSYLICNVGHNACFMVVSWDWTPKQETIFAFN